MKDCTTCKYGFVDEQLGFPMCHHPKRFSEDCVDFNMHEEVEEPKKATGIEEKNLPEGLDAAADKAVSNARWRNVNREDSFGLFSNSELKELFIAGAEWQRKQGVTVKGYVLGAAQDSFLAIENSKKLKVFNDGSGQVPVIVQIRKK